MVIESFTIILISIALQESQMPLTDPRDAVAQRMLNIPYRIIW